MKNIRKYVIGVNITLKGSTDIGIITNIDGKYTLMMSFLYPWEGTPVSI